MKKHPKEGGRNPLLSGADGSLRPHFMLYIFAGDLKLYSEKLRGKPASRIPGEVIGAIEGQRRCQ